MMTMMTHEKRLNTFCVDKKYDVKNDHNLDFSYLYSSQLLALVLNLLQLVGTFNSRESLSSTKNHHLDDENYYFDDDKGDGPVGRGSRPPSAVESSRSSYLEMLEPISEYFIMIIMMLVSMP